MKRSLGRLRHRHIAPVVALDGVSFQVMEGEALGVIGRNGAGKSTLMRVLAGTLQPDAGSVEVEGHTSTLLSLGLGFNPELSGRRNVYLGGLAAGLTRTGISEIFNDVVSYAELEEAIDRPLKTYSSGMFARLAFSIGMHLSPDVLLLDEVLAVGDAQFQRKSLGSMRKLLDKSGTIVLVSHSLRRVSEICDRVLWIDEGQVRGIGPADEIVSEYRTSVDSAVAGAGTSEAVEGWHAGRKMDVVLRVLAGEAVEELAEEFDTRREWIELWRDRFVASGKEGLRAAKLKAARASQTETQRLSRSGHREGER